MQERNKSQLQAAVLALLLGMVGAHAWYLGRPKAWVWAGGCVFILLLSWSLGGFGDKPWIHLLLLPATCAVVESVVLALRDPNRFDRLYNPGATGYRRLGWSNVLMAVLATLVGGTVLLYWLAVAVMAVYQYAGWLDLGMY